MSDAAKADGLGEAPEAGESSGASAASGLVEWVEPRLGTRHTRWIHLTSAAWPQPMITVSPDTRVDGDWGCGYALADESFVGISHVHDWQLAGLMVMPVSGAWSEPRGDRSGTVGVVEAGREALRSRFDRSAERCKPGDHRFVLLRDGTGVELTATRRTAWHRYRFASGGERSVAFDLAGPLGPCEMRDASIEQVGERRFELAVTNAPTRRRSQPTRLWFVLDVSVDARLQVPDGRGWRDAATAGGEALRGRLRLAAGEEPVVVRVAMSYTSMAGARANGRAEAEPYGDDFDAVRADAAAEWGRWLSRIDASAVASEHRPRFVTDLFFALAGRRTCSDADGSWVDHQGDGPVVRRVPTDPRTGRPTHKHYNSDALWGAQWSLVPLWRRHFPELLREFCECFYDYARHGGYIPRGPSGGRDTFVMTSAQATPMFAAAMIHGVWTPDDPHAVFDALRANHLPGGAMSKCGYEHDTCDGGGIEDYLALGYVPEDRPESGFHCNGCAQTVEHAFNDHALARLAAHLGRADDAETFSLRAKRWRNVFDRSLGFVRPRLRDGSWREPFDPFAKVGMTEANAWTYSLYAAHDLDGLVACHGSREALLARLQDALARSEADGFFAPHGKHERVTLDFGNEPPLAVPYLFAALGDPARSRAWVDRIMNRLKAGNARDDWYGGDEDQGMMGAWSVLARLGEFSLDGGCDPALDVTLPPSPDAIDGS